MRIRRITVQPERAYFYITMEIAQIRVRLDFFWRSKVQAWYMSIYREDDLSPMVTSVRLAPNSMPLKSSNPFDLPMLFLVVGEEYDKQRDLGDKIELIVFDRLGG